jgi:hypothetical protein
LLVLHLAQQVHQTAFSIHYESIMTLHIPSMQPMQHHSSACRGLQDSNLSAGGAYSSSMQQCTHQMSYHNDMQLLQRLPPTQLLLWLQR